MFPIAEPAVPGAGLGAANGPSPLPEPGTANIALCNFTGQPVKFKVCGLQGQVAVTKEVVVPAYTFIWSTGWSAGKDKVLTATTPYNTKVFCPFVTSDLIAIYQA
jgi:hypothetical protein